MKMDKVQILAAIYFNLSQAHPKSEYQKSAVLFHLNKVLELEKLIQGERNNIWRVAEISGQGK